MRNIAAPGHPAFSLEENCHGMEQTIPLWFGPVPGAFGGEPGDIPTLTHFPSRNAGPEAPALVILPGGGYAELSDYEGAGYAGFFTKHGIQCFVLKYRLGSDGYHHPAMLQDAARALRLVRSSVVSLGVNPRKIGVVGSSAGGHLASTLLTHFDAGNPASQDPVEKVSSRPDFGILCYPVISMGKITHEGSRWNLLGPNPSVELVTHLSTEKQVSRETPPCFIWHTVEDQVVKVENAMAFAEALRAVGVPFDLHLYEKGQHGLGLGDEHPWSKDCLFWLAGRGVLEPVSPSKT